MVFPLYVGEDKLLDSPLRFPVNDTLASDKEKGKCGSCGFLSLQAEDRHMLGPHYYEMDTEGRSKELLSPLRLTAGI